MRGPARPLTGVCIAVTRAGDRGFSLAEQLRATGASVHEVPLTRIESLPGDALLVALRSLREYQWLLFTSVNGVSHVSAAMERLPQRELVGALLRTRRVAVVGEVTATAVRALGWQPTVVPESFHAEALLDALSERTDIDGARVLYPAAAGARDVLPAGLRALGATVDVVPVYRSAPDPDGRTQIRELALAGSLDLVTVAAPSAVDALLDALPPEHARRLPVACIGPVTAKAARVAGFPVRVESSAATVEGWVRSIVLSFAG